MNINWKLHMKLLCIILALGLLTAMTDRFNLREYDEECYEHKKVPYNITTYNVLRGYYNFTWFNITNECVAYHLVRRVQ